MEDDKTPTYEKRANTADMAGEDFELSLCALLFLRGVNHCPAGFFLANNHNQAGQFDDVVFLWRQQVGAERLAWRAVLLQQKHKKSESVSRAMLLPVPQESQKDKAGRSNLSLVKYCHSYSQEVRRRWQQLCTDVGAPPGLQVSVCLFTNATLDDSHEERTSCAPDIFDTGGDEVTFSLDNIDVTNAFAKYDNQEDVAEFLLNFRLLCTQASLERLEELIKTELMMALGTSPGKVTDGAFTSLLSHIKAWWTSKGRVPYLTESSGFWRNIVCKQMDDLGGQLKNSLDSLNLQYKEVATDAFRKVLCANQDGALVVTCERGCAALCGLLARQALVPGGGLAVCEDEVRGRRAEVSAALSSRFCRWLLLLLPAGLDRHTEEALLHARQRRPHGSGTAALVLVTESDKICEGMQDRWNLEEDKFSFLDLDDASEKFLLEKVVIFQGESTTIGKILQGADQGTSVVEAASRLLTGRRVLRLASGAPPPVLGASLDATPACFVPRALRRQCALAPGVLWSCGPSDVFALSDLKAASMRRELAAGAVRYHDGLDQLPAVVILQSRQAVTQFQKLGAASASAGRHLHWLTPLPDGAWRWERSVGDSAALRPHLLLPGTWGSAPTEDALAVAVGERCVVVRAPPGMGKSALVRRLAAAAKRRRPHSLVVALDFGRYSQELHDMTMDAGGLRGLLQLAAGVDPLADEGLGAELLDWCLFGSGEAVVFLDAFDEVSDYDAAYSMLDKALDALRLLKDATRARKLWATTRPSTGEAVEAAAGVVAFELPGLTADQQAQLFSHVLHQLQAGAAVVSEVERLRVALTGFAEVPLHARMLAEVAGDGGAAAVLRERAVDLRRLYEAFFNRKADIYQRDKRRLRMGDPATAREAQRSRDVYQATLAVLALKALFSPEEVNVLLGQDDGSSGSGTESEDESALAAYEQTGTVLGVARGRPQFVHRTFAEYFGALWFCRAFEPRRRRRQRGRLGQREGVEARARPLLALRLATPQLHFFGDMLARMLCKEVPLHVAVLHNDAEEVQRLLDAAPADVAAVDVGGRNPLHLAAIYSTPGVARLLLSRGAAGSLAVSDRVLSWRPLRYADAHGAWEVAELLLSAGAAAEDLSRTRQDAERNQGAELLGAFSRQGFCQLTRFLLRDCGVPANTVTDPSRAQTALHAAAQRGDAPLARLLLEAGADPEARDTGGRTPLHLLCEGAADAEADLEAARALLEAGATVAGRLSTAGVTPLHSAAARGCASLLRCLLTHGRGAADEALRFPDKQGRTALHAAALRGRSAALEALLELGADPDSRDRAGCTPLHIASRHGWVDAVRLLLRRGATADAKDAEGLTPLYGAANGLCVRALLEGGAHPEGAAAEGEGDGRPTPLAAAVRDGRGRGVICELLSGGANLEVRDENGHTPLYTAASRGVNDTVQILFDEDRTGGTETLRLAVESSDATAVRTLLEVGVPLDGDPPLLLEAARRGHADVVTELLNLGAAVDVTDTEGRTALHIAAAAGHSEVCSVLLTYGANNRVQNAQGRQPLHEAADEATAEVLWNATRDDISPRDFSGQTPLHTAAANNRDDVVRFLLKAGCDKDSEDKLGNRPLHAAMRLGHIRTAHVLLEAGVDSSAKNEEGLTARDLSRHYGLKIIKKYDKMLDTCKKNSTTADRRHH